MNRLASASAFACLLSTPALADPALLSFLTSGIDGGSGGGLRGAYAACLLGGGDAEKAAEIWTSHGWVETRDDEMGVLYLSSPQAPWYVAMYQNGAICEVGSNTIGTPQATMDLVTVLGMTGFAMVEGSTCPAYEAIGARLELTSAGQDPNCADETTSALRVIFPGNE